jgi:folate-binding protein YgfZ
MLVKFSDRILLKIYNESVEEILKFLQQIVSNDLINNKDALSYNLFLSGNGKFLFDGFVFNDDSFVYLDCLKEIKDSLISHIKKYKARLNIKIEDVNYIIYQNFDNEKNYLRKDFFVFQDPRDKNFGKRIYSMNEIDDELSEENEYHKYRVKNNISEGCYEMIQEQSFPIYFKMHDINAISLKKGCYLGQEPTNRLYRTGVLRKEIKSFFLNEKNYFLKKGEKFEMGTICSIFDNQFGFLMKEKEDFNIDKL